MDQDSKFIDDSIDKIARAISIYNKIAIISPFQATKFVNFPNNKSKFSIVPMTMTSGNLFIFYLPHLRL